jgi:DNA-binding IclR family transcriptional regulator
VTLTEGLPDQLEAPKSILSRTSILLQAFEAGQPDIPLRELAARIPLPKSTVHRLAEQLADLGWLERTALGYRVGMRLFEFGELAVRRTRLLDAALMPLQEAAAATKCVAHLAILDGTEVLCLGKVPVRAARAPTRVGGRLPTHSTALGKALLAFSADEAAVPDKRLRALTSHTIVNPDRLHTVLAHTRDSGVARDEGETWIGISCIAAPIRGAGRAIGAISVHGPSEAVDFRHNANTVQRAAAAVYSTMFSHARP